MTLIICPINIYRQTLLTDQVFYKTPKINKQTNKIKKQAKNLNNHSPWKLVVVQDHLKTDNVFNSDLGDGVNINVGIIFSTCLHNSVSISYLPWTHKEPYSTKLWSLATGAQPNSQKSRSLG